MQCDKKIMIMEVVTITSKCEDKCMKEESIMKMASDETERGDIS